MYHVETRIIGVTSLLMHKYPDKILNPDSKSKAKKRTGAQDYSYEYLETMYVLDGYLYQPALHIEASMIKAASNFKQEGKRNKTWVDPFKSYVYVTPDKIYHRRFGELQPAPDESLAHAPAAYMAVNVARVTINRAAVSRARLEIFPGWELDFIIEVRDDQLGLETLRDVLVEAGKSKGIGDKRPRHGQFQVERFEQVA